MFIGSYVKLYAILDFKDNQHYVKLNADKFAAS